MLDGFINTSLPPCLNDKPLQHSNSVQTAAPLKQPLTQNSVKEKFLKPVDYSMLPKAPNQPIKKAHPSHNVTRQKICDHVAKETGYSKTDVIRVLNGMTELISAAIASGQDVKVNSFGSFNVRRRGTRYGQNPLTGKKYTIPPGSSVVFVPSKKLSVSVKKNYSL
ncbi:HU family DNA-binding protein [uncultured Devosia sp.]|uniref:HU family DNA-binding protein n=1 Tax=uncultured Devosia sp. TaxID=211434 RepID=UPI0030EB29EB